MKTPPNREQEIFAEAIEIASSSKRRAFVERVCGDDSALAKRVWALLAAREATADMPPERSLTEGPGRVIDRYKLLEKIGEGGDGEVYAGPWRIHGSQREKKRITTAIASLYYKVART